MNKLKLLKTMGIGILLGASIAFTALAAEPGWSEEDGQKRYADNSGNYVRSQWRTVDGKSYYLDGRGYLATDTWIEDTYYVDSQGVMQKNTWIEEDGASGQKSAGWYYVGRDGKAEKNDWKTIDGHRYSFDNEGKMRTGWHYEDGETYYLGTEEEGFAQSGWQFLAYNGKNLPKEGEISRELSEGSSAGRWFYFQKNGKEKKARGQAYEAFTIEDKKYYFGEDGAMLTGWHCVRETAEPGDAVGISRFVYLGGKEEGVLKSQWIELTEHPWTSSDKSALTVSEETYKGPKKGETARYYLKNDGTPAFLAQGAASLNSASQRIGKEHYFFDPYGCLQTGLVRLGSGTGAQVGYFGSSAEDAYMHYGRVTDVEDQAGRVLTCYFGTSGSDKGVGITGEKDGFLYYRGILVSAKEGTDYEPFLVGGKLYLVNESGKIQTSEKKYQSDGKYAYVIEDGILYGTDEDGEKKEEVKSGKILPVASYHYTR